MIKVAFGSVPKDGGTFTFYRNQRPFLLQHGIDLRCVTVGRKEAQLQEESYVDDGCVLLQPATHSIKKQAVAFTRWCQEARVDIVMGINSEAILSALPHLPEAIRCISRCANAFDHGYRITLSCRERLAAVVAITPRLQRDLTTDYNADPHSLHLIPNGIDGERFEKASRSVRGKDHRLRLGFLGRLEHKQKGVLHLPQVVRELRRNHVPFELRIAGKGRHRTVLEHELRSEIEDGLVRFVDAVPAEKVPDFLGGIDVFVFTSHFEGCPNALLEAMMAGCVPVSFLIEGITDFIIEDGINGLLCPAGDATSLAGRIADLHADRVGLARMGAKSAASARQRFSSRACARAYATLFQQISREPPPPWSPKPWAEFRSDPNFVHSWKDWIPRGFRDSMLQSRIVSAWRDRRQGDD